MAKSPDAAPATSLVIVGASENNLKEVDCCLPHDHLTVVTGYSGSGKSSLAFSTVYAEGQRRYLETFSPYVRQFFNRVKKPDATLIDHVRPAIAIQQRTRITNSRSTVGSMTNLNDYLKVLWSNLSAPACPSCGETLTRWTSMSAASAVSERAAKNSDSSIVVCAPIRARNGASLADELLRLQTLGYSRYYDATAEATVSFDALVDGEARLAALGEEVLIALDRLRGSQAGNQSALRRLQESIGQAFELGAGELVVAGLDDEQALVRFSTSYRCSRGCSLDHASLPAPRPSLFSYNHPAGACQTCSGFGRVLELDLERIVPNSSLSLAEGAIHPWTVRASQKEQRRLERFCKQESIPLDVPWRALPAASRDRILNERSRSYRGVMPWFETLERKIYKMHVRVFLSRYRSQFECPACHGARLKPEALLFKLEGQTLPGLWSLPVGEALEWMVTTETKLSANPAFPRAYTDIFTAVRKRLEYMRDLGLSYLSLDRQARTLSGGETQRVNLAAALGSELSSTQFVLDEPSVGLHPRDTDRLIRAVHALRDAGNSVMMVEHDIDCIRSADWIVELGPEAGNHGGEIVFSGPIAEWPGERIEAMLPAERKPRPRPGKQVLAVRAASVRNLKNIDVDIPCGQLVCLTGVSGSGKSTLVSAVILEAYRDYQQGLRRRGKNRVNGFSNFEQVLLVDQSSPAKSPRANIATYTKIWDAVRDLLAKTEEARLRRLTKSSFSFNVEGGRCPECKGAGSIREDMQFLSDVYLLCERCLGRRFLPVVLEVQYRGRNAHEFLSMTVDECAEFFVDQPQVRTIAEHMRRLGLGHLRLGHPLSELSGGEAQRLKLVPFLQRAGKGTSLLIFDEPTTGLHLHDVHNLLSLLQDLVDIGHTVLCIEHNPTVMLGADWLVDLGPEGGDGGGSIVLQGRPDAFLKPSAAKKSFTAYFLAQFVAAAEQGPDRIAPSGHLGSAPRRGGPQALLISGAREHNLKNIDLEVPIGKRIALTGVSGSGKSTIAKDIIYAEGQRRYLDCLSPYARQFIKELRRPDLDRITNVQPTVCVYQHTFQPSRLSTIATMSEVYNFLRLLFAKVGVQFCPDHPEERITPLSADGIAAEILALDAPSVRVLAPIIKHKKGFHRSVFKRAIESEILEVRVDGAFGRPAQFEEGLVRGKSHTVDFVIGRFNPRAVDPELVRLCIEQALGLGEGEVVVHCDGHDSVYSSRRTCPICKTGFFQPDPEDLSFNSQRGVCQECSGTGRVDDDPCPECEGARIGPIGRNLRIEGKNIYELCLLTSSELLTFLDSASERIERRAVAEPVLRELRERLSALTEVGLDYLPLARGCSTLSGGELQRLRLAAAMGSPLTGAMYIFDEPSAGLHPLDNERVLDRFEALQRKGNSILLIDHEQDTILSAEHIIDVGPGGGSQGGRILFNGDLHAFLAQADSITAQEMRTPRSARFERSKRRSSATNAEAGFLRIRSGSANNIRNLSLDIPLGTFVAFAGVSGAGKSSLVHSIVHDTLDRGKQTGARWTLEENLIEADLPIDRMLLVDQKPIGRTPRSIPASYLGIWDDIRKLFASTVEAKARGWSASFFSFNSGAGRCPECKGQGRIRLEMNFLPDAVTECEACRGTRFSDEAATIRYLGLSIRDVLALTLDEARVRFANHRRLHEALHQACELGLGYLTLGQASSTLSGGESQRIKLVSELSYSRSGHTLYMLDEPTTGLHRADVARLAGVLKQLVQKGSSVFVIEHDPDLLLAAEHIVELGPGPGEAGGKVIFQGSPARLVKARTPWGRLLREKYLRNDLGGSPTGPALAQAV